MEIHTNDNMYHLRCLAEGKNAFQNLSNLIIYNTYTGQCECDNSKYVMPNMNNEQKTFFLQVSGNSILKLVESPVVQNAWQNWIVTLSETNVATGRKPSKKETSLPTIHFQV